MVFGDLGLEANYVPPDREWGNGSSVWRLVLVKQGEVAFRVDSTEHAARRREGLLVPAGVDGVVTSALDADVACLCLHFCPEGLGGMLRLGERLLFQRAAGRSQCIRVLKRGNPCLQGFEDLAESFTPAHRLHPRDLAGLIKPLVTELRNALQDASETAGDALSRLVAILETEATESDLQRLSVSDLARRCGCSRRHLNRLVQERFGCTILALKTQLRLEQAAMLLRDRDPKIIGVALACGFNHLGSFTAKFRRLFGATPKKWRDAILFKERPGTTTVSRGSGNRLFRGEHTTAGIRAGQTPVTATVFAGNSGRPVQRNAPRVNPRDRARRGVRVQPNHRRNAVANRRRPWAARDRSPKTV